MFFHDRATISGKARITREGYFVADALVAKANNIQDYRAVELGPMVDGLRIVRSGLKPGEQIIVSGLQRVRPNDTVDPVLAGATPPQAKLNNAQAGTEPSKKTLI